MKKEPIPRRISDGASHAISVSQPEAVANTILEAVRYVTEARAAA